MQGRGGQCAGQRAIRSSIACRGNAVNVEYASIRETRRILTGDDLIAADPMLGHEVDALAWVFGISLGMGVVFRSKGGNWQANQSFVRNSVR